MNQDDENTVTWSDPLSWREGKDLEEGTHIDRYQILGLLGKGGMGAVYRAYDPELDRSVAIKILTVKPQEGETASRPQTRLIREAQALAKLSHPNVVAVHDVGTYEDGIYITMEYVKGKTLREWFRGVHQEGAARLQPSQEEILRVLLEAGKGLYAAHSAGIFHRDFKPDNVLIGDKGQVKVLDFGLARAAGSEETAIPCEKPTPDQKPISGERLLSTPFTKVGAMVGTIVYMAPEHFAFQELDEKTDQFSFCVTLFEALYGKRPFPGETVEELAENITSGCIEIPQEANVPKWIEEIILKGISNAKDDRHQSIAALMDALKDDPEIVRAKRRKKVQSIALTLLLAMMTIGLGYYAFFRSSKVCTGAQKKVAGIWNDEKRDKIRQAFANTGLSYASDSFGRLSIRIDEYLGQWKNEFTETCEATRIRGEQSDETMDLTMGCLNKLLMNVAALIQVLGKADNKAVEKSVRAVSSLSTAVICRKTEALRSKSPPPKDEIARKKVRFFREKLAEVEALSKTGKYRQGLKIVEDLSKEVYALDYRPVLAELLFIQGELLEVIGEYKKAETTLHDAALAAGESRDFVLTAKAMALLVYVVGYQQARFDVGLQVARDAEIVLEIAGRDQEVLALLKNNVGALFHSKGSYDSALENFRNTLVIREKVLGPKHPDVAFSMNNIGVTFLMKNRYEKALKYMQNAFAILDNALGPEHPDVAMLLNNLGNVFSSQSKYNKALAHYQKSLAINQRALGTEHPLVAYALNNIGNVFKLKGNYEKALGYYRKSLAIREKTLGQEHPQVAEPLSGIGNLLFEQGKVLQALSVLKRVVGICKKNKCESEPHTLALFSLARALIETEGDKKHAIELAKQARVFYGRTPSEHQKELEEVDAWLEEHDPGKTKTKKISTTKR